MFTILYFMFPIHSWSSVILHMDGDAFFAAVMQSIYPSLRGKPVIIGRERGLATAFSYEAKNRGVKRGMLTHEIKKICPDAVFVDSDFEAFGLFSRKLFDIARNFSPIVEEYSIDEGFLDIKGMRRPLALGYVDIGATLQEEVRTKLGISISVGVSLTKSLAKLASSKKKPGGLVIVPGQKIADFLADIPIGSVWGIGENTGAYLKKVGIPTALDFASQPESFFLKGTLAKPYVEIWHELRGTKIYEINPQEKDSYKSISRTQTFSPATNDEHILLSKLMHHVEQAFEKARSLQYVVGKVYVFLKTQKFTYHSTEITLVEKTSYPLLIRDELIEAFHRIYKKGVLYRATGCAISDLQDQTTVQQGLFTTDPVKENKVKRVYDLFQSKKIDFGSKLFDKDRFIGKKPMRKLRVPLYDLR